MKVFTKDLTPFYVGLFYADYQNVIAGIKNPKQLSIKRIENSFSNNFVQKHHYLHRKLYIARNVSYGIFASDYCVGVCMFGYPVWIKYPGIVPPLDIKESPELLRLCTMAGLPRNTESYFVAKCLKLLTSDWDSEVGMTPKCVTSFCDEAMGFNGSLYKALNFDFLRRTAGRPSNPGQAHGKWKKNTFAQAAVKAMYVFWYDRKPKGET